MKIIIGFIVVIMFSCGQAPNNIKVVSLPDLNDSSILISSGQISPFKTIFIDNVEFQFVGSNADTQYLSTSDTKFITPEGYKVGMKMSEINKELQNKNIKLPGWGFYIQLESGWRLAFCEGNSCTDQYPQDSSAIDWIFKNR